MPACKPSAACEAHEVATGMPARHASILFALHADASHLRFFYGRNVQKAYASQLGLLLRAVRSLRVVNTSLPIHVLVSGHRSPAAEARLSQLGVTVLGPDAAPEVTVPTWASKWARASFAKLRALALERFDTVILLDTDAVVLRNIDHLAARPMRRSPAFVVGFKCFPRRELRAAVGVLAPSKEQWAKAQALMALPSTAIYDDLGEQSVWRHLYKDIGVFELPIGYAALRSSDLPASEWDKVSVLHDPNLLRKASRQGWKEARMAERIKPLDEYVAQEMSTHMTPAIDKETKERQAAAVAALKAKGKGGSSGSAQPSASNRRHRGKRRAKS